MMVIGNGMIATAFRNAGDINQDLLVFASGVSNSQEQSSEAFEKERSLLRDSIARFPECKTVYFSSCSVGFIDSPYYRHKAAMEELVMQEARRHLVCRLPQVVGATRNATLVNHVAKRIRSREPVSVFENAYRNLIGIDDVVRITLRLSKLSNMKVQVTNGNMMTMESIVGAVSEALRIPALTEIGARETVSSVYDGSELKLILGADDPIYAENYVAGILLKYADRLGF
jgi:nucleoside-diphosphate-sugar epimerase